MKLRKIKIAGVFTVGLLIAIAGLTAKAKADNESNLVAVSEIENNLDQNELPMIDQLTQYSIAVEEYLDVMEDKNHSLEDEVVKRVEVVKQTKELTNTADYLMKEKVKEALGITDENIEISIFRDTTSGSPIDCVIGSNSNHEEVYRATKVPKEVRKILNLKEEISVYNGSGQNKAWEQGIDKFMKFGYKLYNSIVDLSEKEFYLDGEEIKCQKNEKAM